jgi:cytochrome c-type biogenesis protein
MEFLELGFLVQAAIAFGGGVIAFVSPCVLPLLPGYLALMSGYSVAELQAGEASTARMLRVTLMFVAGFTVVFVALGAGATSVSRFLIANLNAATRVAGLLILGFGILIVGAAFTNKGVFGFFSRERRLDVRPSRLGASAPVAMGVAFGFGWTPCIGPILAGVLTVAATQATVARGMLLLLAFSLGLGVPFVLSGLGVNRALATSQGLRRHLRPINIAAGAVMAAFGLLMFFGGVDLLSRFFANVFTAVPGLERLAEV